MRKWFAAGGAALLAIVAIVLWRTDRAPTPARTVQAFADVTATSPLAAPPAADPARARYRRTRAVAPDAYEPDAKSTEEKRLARYDKDRDGFVSKDEYLANRKKSFEKLDLNHDGKLSSRSTPPRPKPSSTRRTDVTPVNLPPRSSRRLPPSTTRAPNARRSRRCKATLDA